MSYVHLATSTVSDIYTVGAPASEEDEHKVQHLFSTGDPVGDLVQTIAQTMCIAS